MVIAKLTEPFVRVPTSYNASRSRSQSPRTACTLEASPGPPGRYSNVPGRYGPRVSTLELEMTFPQAELRLSGVRLKGQNPDVPLLPDEQVFSTCYQTSYSDLGLGPSDARARCCANTPVLPVERAHARDLGSRPELVARAKDVLGAVASQMPVTGPGAQRRHPRCG